MESFISPNDHWSIWTYVVCITLLSLLLEQKFNWAKKITGPVIAILGGMVASSIGFMPTESESYDIIWDYIIPLCIPMLLLKANIFTIFKGTGRLMNLFHIASLGTVVGSFIAYYAFKGTIEHLEKITPAMAASYTGGGVNFVAMVAVFNPPKDIVNATLVADSGVMLLYFLLLIVLPGTIFFRKFFPYTEKTKNLIVGDKNENEDFWKAKPISLLDIAKTVSIAFIIAMASVKISNYFNSDQMPTIVRIILGQKYLLLTTISIMFPLAMPKTSKTITGNDEIATFLIYLFFVTIGLPASIKAVIVGAPLMFLFCALILLFNFLFVILLGKLFKYELEEIVLAGALTAGGPMNGVAIAISKQWHKMVLPSMMVGVWGYVIGNYIGYLVGLAIGA